MIKPLLICAALLVQGCAIWDFIKPVSKGIAVETEIVTGDKQETIKTTVAAKRETTNTTNTADTITQTFTTVHKGRSFLDNALRLLAAFLAGWLLMPSSRQMFLMIKKRFI